MGITELIKDGNNVKVKDAAGVISAVFPSLGTSAHSSDCNNHTVYLSASPSDRDIKARLLAIDIRTVTLPTPPVGGWTQPLFIQELNDNFLNCPLDVNAVVNIPAGLATETTLIEVRDKIESKFGNTPNKSTIAVSDTSANILTANVLRKEVYVVNNTTKTVWVCFGSPAVFNQGIKLVSGAIWIEDVYRGLVSAIMDTGQSGNIQVTDVLE